MSSRSGKLQRIFRWSRRKGRPPEEFRLWANDDSTSAEAEVDRINFGKHPQGRNVNDAQDLRHQLISNPNASRRLLIYNDLSRDQSMLCFEDSTPRIHFNTLGLESSQRNTSSIIINNIASRRLNVNSAVWATVKLSNCWIERLYVHKEARVKVDVTESHIAHLELNGGASVINLTIQNSSIGSVGFHHETFGPIVGNVRFTNVWTPRGASWYTKKGPAEADQWAQAKRDLANLGNEWAAGYFTPQKCPSVAGKHLPGW
jgi:hypothetical protein